MKKILVILSAILLITVCVPKTLAYFYTYTKAEGTMSIILFDDTDIGESFDSETRTKQMTVSAEKGSDPVFIRAKMFTTSFVEVQYTDSTGWSQTADANGYYYYQSPIYDDGENDPTDKNTTKSFNVKVVTDPATLDTENTYDIVIIYESTPAFFSAADPGTHVSKWQDTENGGWWYSDWNKFQVVVQEGGE